MSEHVQGEVEGQVATVEAGLHPEHMGDRPPPRQAIYEDLKEVPPHFVGEIIGGELHVSPRPNPRHARAAFRLGTALGPFDRNQGVEGPGGWVLLFEPELHLGDEVLVPDLAGWRRERLPELPDTAGLTLAPDWVCEVLSPSTEALDRVRKMASYAREGVRHLWLVDPRPQVLEVYRLDEGHWSRSSAHLGNVSVQAQPFEQITLDLGALWER